MSNKLTFANTGPQLSHIIKDHPKWTAIAEAVRNMIEASTSYYKNDEPIELKIRKLDINSGLIGFEDENELIIDRFKNKLSFLNPGGMTFSELDTAFCKIGSSIGKINSIDRNYGQGIRTATLFWTDLLCITYKKDTGQAYYVWLGKKIKTGNDFEIEIKSADGTDNVQECTSWVKENAKNREYNLDEDFTEVIFLGKEADPRQDTFLDPYGDGKTQSTLWIRKALYTRFWTLPSNVKIMMHLNILSKDTAKKTDGYRQFMTFSECLNHAIAKVTVKPKLEITKSSDTGARIHYIHDAQLPEDATGETGYKHPVPYSQFKANDNGWGGGNISGIILGNEMYDVKSESAAEQSALIKLGIQQNFRNFKIMYELPSNSGHTHDMYRTTVLEGQDPVLFDDEVVLQDIVDNMPAWFKKLVEDTKMTNRMDLNDEIKNRLNSQASLMNAFKGVTKNGTGSVKGQRRNKPREEITTPTIRRKKPQIKNRRGNRLGDPVIPTIIPNPSVTEPYFAKVEGTKDNPTVFTNPDWKQLENLATKMDVEQDKGRWYKRAKDLLEREFTISAVIWYLNALSENLEDNITSDEYRDTVKPKSINMYLMAIQTSIYAMVHDIVMKEYRNEGKVFKPSVEVDPDVVTNGVDARDTDISDIETKANALDPNLLTKPTA